MGIKTTRTQFEGQKKKTARGFLSLLRHEACSFDRNFEQRNGIGDERTETNPDTNHLPGADSRRGCRTALRRTHPAHCRSAGGAFPPLAAYGHHAAHCHLYRLRSGQRRRRGRARTPQSEDVRLSHSQQPDGHFNRTDSGESVPARCGRESRVEPGTRTHCRRTADTGRSAPAHCA